MTAPPPERRLAANALLQLATTAFALLSGGVISIVIARVLGPAEMGSYALAIIIGGGVKILAGFGLERTAQRFTAELAGQPMASRVVWWLLVRRSGAAIVASVALALAAPTIGWLLRDPALPPLLIVGAGVILLELVGSLLDFALQGASRFDLLARSSVWLTPTHLVTTVFALVLDGRALSVMVAHLVTGLVGIGLIVWLARRAELLGWRMDAPTPDLTARMGRFARHGYWLSMLTFVVHDRVEVLVLGALTASTAVGLYSASVGAANAAMSVGPVVVSSIFFPLLAADWSRGDRTIFAARYAQCLRYLTFAAAPLALGGIGLAEAGVAVIFGQAYAPMVPVLRVTLLATALAALAQGPNAVLAAVERQDWLLKVGAPLAAVNLVLDFILIPMLGPLGAAWANLVVAVGEVAFLGLAAWRLAGAPPPLQAFLPIVAAVLASGAAMLALGDRLDVPGLVLGVAAAIPVYLGGLVIGRFFRKEDAEVIAPLLTRIGADRLLRRHRLAMQTDRQGSAP
jgi:O-antigen/teichoic acid export membrane protein